jgi:hypothetical protein
VLVDIPFFGREWGVTVKLVDGRIVRIGSQPDQGDTPLRVTFTVETFMLLSYWFARVTIYNPSAKFVSGPDVTSFLHGREQLLSGNIVSLQAGYKAGLNAGDTPIQREAANLLYTGNLYQSLWERENVVDFKLTLRCATGFIQDAYNRVNITIAAGATDYDAILAICGPKPDGANLPIKEIDAASTAELKRVTYGGSQTFFDAPYDLIRKITDQHGLFAWVAQGGVTIRAFDPADIENKAPRIIYAPPGLNAPPGLLTPNSAVAFKPTVIGVPTQTQDGISFRVLLDSQVQIGDLIQLDPGTFINQYQFQLTTDLPPLANRLGLYVVQGIRHVGDSRGKGDDWYTEIQGLTRGFFTSWFEGNDSNTQQPEK